LRVCTALYSTSILATVIILESNVV
jgi:hypothetical protein